MSSLREHGVRIAIDDFGSGHSALRYLREFPVDEVKLDRHFIAPILDHLPSAAIARAVIDLARALDITSVPKGRKRRNRRGSPAIRTPDIAQ